MNALLVALVFVAGVAVGLVYAYWDKIAVLLNLKQSGAIDSGQKVAEGIGELVNEFKSGKLFHA